MPTTQKTNVFIPQVAAQMISAGLPKAIKFLPFVSIDTTLSGRPGDTITIPKWNYIGDATVVGEGQKIDTTLMSHTTQQATIKKVAKGAEITDEAKLSGYGDPIGECIHQLKMSIASAIDNDVLEVMKTAKLTVDKKAEQISYNGIVDAVDKFSEEDDNVQKVLFVHPSQVAKLRKDKEFIDKTAYGNQVMMDGEIGMVADCRVVKSNKIDVSGATIDNYIVQLTPEGEDGHKPLAALTLYIKRDVQVETGRDIKAKTDIATADQHYVVALTNDSKVLKVTFKK